MNNNDESASVSSQYAPIPRPSSKHHTRNIIILVLVILVYIPIVSRVTDLIFLPYSQFLDNLFHCPMLQNQCPAILINICYYLTLSIIMNIPGVITLKLLKVPKFYLAPFFIIIICMPFIDNLSFISLIPFFGPQLFERIIPWIIYILIYAFLYWMFYVVEHKLVYKILIAMLIAVGSFFLSNLIYHYFLQTVLWSY